MTEKEVVELLRGTGAFVEDSHIIGTSGKHLSSYINKDAVYTHTDLVSTLGNEIAKRFSDTSIDVVAAPAVGGAILGQWVAHHLGMRNGKKVLAVYADKDDEGGFQFKRGYDKVIAEQQVLIVEDIVNTGGSVRRVLEAVNTCKGKIVGVAAICSRAGALPEDIGNPPVFLALVNTTLDIWDADVCPLCKEGIPINTEIGKGRELYLHKISP